MKDLIAGAQPAALVRVGISRAPSARAALREVAAELIGAAPSFVFLLLPPRLDLEEFEAGLRETFLDTTVFGCTTAGQITPEGYENDALVALAFPASHFRFSSQLFKPLSPVAIEATARPIGPQGNDIVEELSVAISLARLGAQNLAQTAGLEVASVGQRTSELSDLIGRYRSAWLTTSRPGGLTDSLAHLDAALAALRSRAGES